MQDISNNPVNFLDQWNPLKLVGSGSTSDVFLVEDKQSSSKQVVKLFKSNVKLSIPENEAKMMLSLSHPRILSAAGYFPKVLIPQKENDYTIGQEAQQHFPAIALEWIPNGDLLGLIQAFRSLPEDVTRTYFLQLIDAVSYLHGKNICHLDIKPDNILIDGNYNLKLADLGVAAHVPKNCLVKGVTGTAVYHAPEIRQRKPYSTYQADIFALGITLFVMMAGNMPFLSADSTDPVYKFIMEGNFEAFWNVHESLKASSCPGFSSDFKNLIESMFSFGTENRLSLEQIRRHHWVTGAVLTEEKLFQVVDAVFKNLEFTKETTPSQEEHSATDQIVNTE